MYNVYKAELENIILFEYVWVRKNVHSKHGLIMFRLLCLFFLPGWFLMFVVFYFCLSSIFPYEHVFVIHYTEIKAWILSVLHYFFLS